MTEIEEKEIIIDGVNVAECEFFEPKAQVMQCHMRAITERCKDNNCYFKQLQRLKAENEKLKKEVSDLNFYIDSYRQVWEVDKYKQALEEINKIAEPRFVSGVNEEADLYNLDMNRIQNKINEVLNDANI